MELATGTGAADMMDTTNCMDVRGKRMSFTDGSMHGVNLPDLTMLIKSGLFKRSGSMAFSVRSERDR